jgi:hypothetical protein
MTGWRVHLPRVVMKRLVGVPLLATRRRLRCPWDARAFASFAFAASALPFSAVTLQGISLPWRTSRCAIA